MESCQQIRLFSPTALKESSWGVSSALRTPRRESERERERERERDRERGNIQADHGQPPG